MKTQSRHYFPLLLFCVTFGLLFSFMTVSSTIHAEEAQPITTETTNTPSETTTETTTENTSNSNEQTTDTTTTEETTSPNDPIKI